MVAVAKGEAEVRLQKAQQNRVSGIFLGIIFTGFVGFAHAHDHARPDLDAWRPASRAHDREGHQRRL
jgi:hypothetical protein